MKISRVQRCVALAKCDAPPITYLRKKRKMEEYRSRAGTPYSILKAGFLNAKVAFGFQGRISLMERKTGFLPSNLCLELADRVTDLQLN